jgi:molybdenum cofactor synthesis domain-containing protein
MNKKAYVLPVFPSLRVAMRKVKAESAVGKRLAHDIIRYGPALKAVLFKRGHVVRLEDVERLKDAGNYFVYVENGEEKGVHEDEAATRMACSSAGENISYTKPNKGAVALMAEKTGLLKVKVDVIKKVNLIKDFVFATQANNAGVRKGDVVGMVKIVPLTVDERRMGKVEGILKKNKPVIEVIPPRVKKIGVITTGTEVYEGRVKDGFGPVLKEKLAGYGLGIEESVVLPDDEDKIREKIIEFRKRGCELILVTGGMAVDSGDVTPAAIRATGAEVVSRGVPIFPGSMVMLAYLHGAPVVGLPACVIPDKRTSFDLLLPRILAKEKITKEELAGMGQGGLIR